MIHGLLVLLLAPIPGCGADTADGSEVLAMTTTLQLYSDVESNPIPQNATAAATAWDTGGKLKLALSVTGFPASVDFGAHLHKLACVDNKAGGHYQHMAAPSMEEVNTPNYANPANEAWLDFTTTADGKASVETVQSWLPRSGEALSVVIHAMKTDGNGRAGDKLACVPLNLP